jgi:ornithine cyclodeaminase/alanine dehydrogenase-like protein (mu-crystallin family)
LLLRFFVPDKEVDMLILKADEVRRALPMTQAIGAMKQAYASLSDGEAEVPLRTRLTIPAREALSLFMPAYVRTENGEALAVKVVSLFPRNPSRGLAYIQAAVLVLDAHNGRAIAVLEGGSLTAIRTGAASGAAIDLLARKESKVAAIFGAGTQGRTQLEAACTARRIDRVFIYDPDPVKAGNFLDELAGRGPIPKDLRISTSSKEAVEGADIICTATTSTKPVFSDEEIKPGAHISAIGSYTPDMQEVPAETVKRARVVVDSRAASLEEAGDIIQPLRAGLFDESHIHAEIGEIILGRKAGRGSENEITYFKSVGLAIQDAVAAQLVLENAREMKLGREVDF